MTTLTPPAQTQPYVPLRPPGFETQRPTGKPAWPLILVEGEEKAGKSTMCVELTASPRIGQSFMLAFGEPHANEYGAIPGANYEIVRYDGSYTDLLAKIDMVRLIAEHANAHGQPPVLLIIDSMVFVWKLLHQWTYNRAKESTSGKQKLAKDPDAEIDPGRNLWNDANSRHANLVMALRRIPGIVIMTGRGKWVSGTDERTGQPTKVKEYTLETQKSLGFDVSCWVRLFREDRDRIIGLTSANPEIRLNAKKDREQYLPTDWSLEWLIFDHMKFEPANAEVPDITLPKPDRSPEQIRQEALRPATPWARLAELHIEAGPFAGISVTNEKGKEETLGEMLGRLMAERAVSDPPTVEKLEKAIAEANTPDALHAVGNTIASAVTSGKVSMADRARLSGSFSAHMAELRAAEVAAAKAARESQGAAQ